MLSWLPRDLQGWEAGGPGSLVGGLRVLGSSEENLDMHLNGLLEPGAGELGCLCRSKSAHLVTITHGIDLTL